MEFFNQPCGLAYVLPFYLFFLPLSILLKGAPMASVPSQRRTYVDFKGGRKTLEAQTFMSKWTLHRRGSTLVWPWLNLQFQVLETFVCNWVSILFSRIFLPHVFCKLSKAQGGRREPFAQNTQPCIFLQNVKQMPGRQTQSTYCHSKL